MKEYVTRDFRAHWALSVALMYSNRLINRDTRRWIYRADDRENSFTDKTTVETE